MGKNNLRLDNVLKSPSRSWKVHTLTLHVRKLLSESIILRIMSVNLFSGRNTAGTVFDEPTVSSGTYMQSKKKLVRG